MSIEPFGFTHTQDVVFWALLRRGNATGYAIALDTGIARANVYHALEVLARRGLAMASMDRPSKYRAMEAKDSLALLSGEVQQDLTDLALRLGVGADAVHPSPQSTAEHGVLRSRIEIVREVLQCIDAAGQEVLAVVGPWVPELVPGLAEARRRGVAVRVASLGRPAPEGAIVRDVPRAELEVYWGGLPVSVVGDRRRAVCGILASGRAEGIATSNAGAVPFLRHLLRRELAAAVATRVS